MASISVTRATLGKNGPAFIRDVLKQNISDVSNRIYKSTPTKLKEITTAITSDAPLIILDLTEKSSERLTIKGGKFVNVTFTIEIHIYANNPSKRDSIADEIETLLYDETSADVDGTTLDQRYLYCKNQNSSVEDYYAGHPNIVRMARISATFRYTGA